MNGLRKEAKLHRKIYDLFMENMFSFASKLYPLSVCSVLVCDFCPREARSYSGRGPCAATCPAVHTHQGQVCLEGRLLQTADRKSLGGWGERLGKQPAASAFLLRAVKCVLELFHAPSWSSIDLDKRVRFSMCRFFTHLSFRAILGP